MRFAFLAGIPRSGSNLLCALLNQRSDVYASTLSESAQVLRYAHSVLPKQENFLAGATEQRKSLLHNALPAMYAHVDTELVIDKNRLWGTPYFRDLLTQALGEPPRILATIRPLAEVAASFLRMLRTSPDNYVDRHMREDDFYPYWRKPIDDARVDWLLLPNGHLGAAMLGLHGAYQEDSADLFHVIEYAALTTDPLPVMRGIESFLDLEPFDYSFTQIVGQPHNDAEVYGIPNMHHVRERIERIDPPPETILSPYAMARCELEDFWS